MVSSSADFRCDKSAFILGNMVSSSTVVRDPCKLFFEMFIPTLIQQCDRANQQPGDQFSICSMNFQLTFQWFNNSMQAMRSDSTERNSGVFLNLAFSISQANLAGATSDATGYV